MDLKNALCVQGMDGIYIMELIMDAICVREEVHVMDVMEEDGFDNY